MHVVDGGDKLTAEDEVAFTLGDYVATLSLVADPTGTYGTYMGQTTGPGNTQLLAEAMDSSGFVYVTGFSLSTGYPTVAPAQATNGSGFKDVVVTKIKESLNITNPPVFSTYLGG